MSSGTKNVSLTLERSALERISNANKINISGFLTAHRGRLVRLPVSIDQYLKWTSSNWPTRLEMLNEYTRGSFSMGTRQRSRNDFSSKFSISTKVCKKKGVISNTTLDEMLAFVEESGPEGHSEKGALFSYKKDGDVYEFELSHDSIMGGEKDETDVPDGKKGTNRCVEMCAGGHTHPAGEYIAQKVAYAWPSHDDCDAFLDKVMFKTSFLHFVFTKEGVYIMSLHPNAIKKGSEFIRGSKKRTGAYRFALPTTKHGMKPSEYISKLKAIPKDEKVLNVDFRSYKDRRPFIFYYPTEGGSCDI